MEAFQERLTTDGLVILAITEPTLAGTEEAPARTEEIQRLITGRECGRPITLDIVATTATTMNLERIEP